MNSAIRRLEKLEELVKQVDPEEPPIIVRWIVPGGQRLAVEIAECAGHSVHRKPSEAEEGFQTRAVTELRPHATANRSRIIIR